MNEGLQNQELSSLPPRRVLIVDDDEKWIDPLTELYTEEGINVIAVGSVEEAKETLRRIKENNEPKITDILCDGLEGGWEKVVEIANGTPFRLFSANTDFGEIAQKRGIAFIYKGKHENDELLVDPRQPPEVKK